MMKLFVFILSCLLLKALWAVQTTEKLWSAIGLNTNVGKFSYQFEPQLRLMDRFNVYDQLLTNLIASYRLSHHWKIALGGTYINTWRPVDPYIEEPRLLQQVIYHSSRFPWLTVRSRFEQRKRQESIKWNYRIRERLTVTKRITDNVNFVSYDEFFITLNKPVWLTTNTFEQNRLMVGLERQAAKSLQVGAGYIFQYILTHPTRQVGHVLTLYLQVTVPNEFS